MPDKKGYFDTVNYAIYIAQTNYLSLVLKDLTCNGVPPKLKESKSFMLLHQHVRTGKLNKASGFMPHL